MKLPAEYYPTPPALAKKMMSKIDWLRVVHMLEPSAGTGNLIEAARRARYISGISCGDKDKWNAIDCVELDENLRHILTGNGLRVVASDFLQFDTPKRYDLIAMNPPFSDGDKHLLKALGMIARGGQVICLLNAETLRNPYTNTRGLLVRRLDELGADIEHIDDAFKDADRRADVDVAMVYVRIEPDDTHSDILENLKQGWQRSEKQEDEWQETHLANADVLKALVDQYKLEAAAGVKLIDEFDALTRTALRDEDDCPFMELKLRDKECGGGVNGYLRMLRKKYWSALLQTKQFTSLLTGNLQGEYRARLEELRDYDISLPNIYQMLMDINARMLRSLEETILALFEKLTYEHSMGCEKNIHYFNGWKTNKAYVINKKVIMPTYGTEWSKSGGSWRIWYFGYEVIEKLADIEKVLTYLDTGGTEGDALPEILERAKKAQQSKDIDCKYFRLTFYQKGTCHLTFKDAELLKKFNIFGCQRKGWLPPSYGKTAYSDMGGSEQAVVDAFEGAKSYERTMSNAGYYFFDAKQVLMLEAPKE